MVNTTFPALALVENGISARRNHFGFGFQGSHFKTVLMHSCSWFFVCFFLVAVGNFFVVVVISALDELKKYDSGAREATKFLEQEFKKGNR